MIPRSAGRQAIGIAYRRAAMDYVSMASCKNDAAFGGVS